MPKEKLTLSVDKEVVKKAKKLGINISDITEKVLKGYTSAEKPNGDLYDAYRQLFSVITPLLREFGVTVKIGEGEDIIRDPSGEPMDVGPAYEISLQADGSFYIDPFDNYVTDIKKIDQQNLLSPEKILANLVEVLAETKGANDEKMRQIMMAKRIVEAMSDTLIRKPSTKKAVRKDSGEGAHTL
jgi:hypothetical protein